MKTNIVYQFYKKALPESLCDIIKEAGLELSTAKGTVDVGDKYAVNTSMRSSDVAFFNEYHWANGLVSHYVAMANRDVWMMDILTSEAIQFGTYGVGGFYDWHTDEYSGPIQEAKNSDFIGLNRKLSVSVTLSAPQDYDGGDMMFKDKRGNILKLPEMREKGSIVVFPSSILHTVTPVTRGVRHSLVAWILGPPLR